LYSRATYLGIQEKASCAFHIYGFAFSFFWLDEATREQTMGMAAASEYTILFYIQFLKIKRIY
jgi:hypothetical protein